MQSLELEDGGALGLAPAVVAVARDPADFVTHHPRAAAELLNAVADTGFLGIIDATGKRWEAQGYSNSAGFSVSWTDPSLGCLGSGCGAGLAYKSATGEGTG